jgi:hypothetical protein
LEDECSLLSVSYRPKRFVGEALHEALRSARKNSDKKTNKTQQPQVRFHFFQVTTLRLWCNEPILKIAWDEMIIMVPNANGGMPWSNDIIQKQKSVTTIKY